MECCHRNKSEEYFASPLQAFQHGPRERLLYVTCVCTDSKNADYLAVVDVDPESKTYSQIIHRTILPNVNDELHHFGWNACSSCLGTEKPHCRTRLIFPTLHSNKVYVLNVAEDPKKPHFEKEIDLVNYGITFPHTTHCLSTGDLMISYLGDAVGNGSGNFVLIDGQNLEFKEKWAKTDTKFGYDFWYQPRLDVMISTEWGSPKLIKKGFNVEDVANGGYGTQLHVWKWSTRQYVKALELGPDGCMPLEIRFLHDPNSDHGYVACGLGSSVYHFYKTEAGEWTADMVIKAETLKVDGWALPEMPAVFTDMLISLDDKFLYVSAWVHGNVLQYDISDRFHPKLVDQIYIGGSLTKDGPVKVLKDAFVQPDPLVIKGRKVNGGAQMIQLSLDGKRLYVTTSLYSVWDKQFYPDLVKNGAVMVQIDIDTVKGGMRINENFLIDFGKEPFGPVLAHEMRYPGGDCTSDIWI